MNGIFYLLAVSILWGFSFGLVKAEFSALSPSTLAAARLLIALPCFLPFLKKSFIRLSRDNLVLLLIGAVQFGLMYVTLFNAFRWLSGYEVALLTIFTPVYVISVYAVLDRRWPPYWFWMTAILSVAGALWILSPQALPDKWPGILLMQLSNLFFAAGQVAWRHQRQRMKEGRDVDGYALLYIGGVLATLPFLLQGNPVAELAMLDQTQWISLVYLGIIASGLGFFLWNAGAARAAPATLAVFNNLKIPVAIVISIMVFKESASIERLVPGTLLLIAALAWAEIAKSRHYQE